MEEQDNLDMKVRMYEIVFRDLIASVRRINPQIYPQMIAQKQVQWVAQQERTGTYAGGTQ